MAVKPAKPSAEKEPDKVKSAVSGDKTKIIAIGVLALGLVLGGGGAIGTLYYLGLVGGKADSSGRQVAVVSLGAPEIIDLPEMNVDLKVGTCRSPYLRFRMSIEAAGSARAVVTEQQPRIMDAIQQHLRGQERQQLVGTEGADRLRNDARDAINRLIAPERINSVIFKKFVLQ